MTEEEQEAYQEMIAQLTDEQRAALKVLNWIAGHGEYPEDCEEEDE